MGNEQKNLREDALMHALRIIKDDETVDDLLESAKKIEQYLQG